MRKLILALALLGLIFVVGGVAAAVLDAGKQEATTLVCDEPNVIAVEETANGVIVRCGPVEGGK